MATTEAMNNPYPARKVVKTVAEARIFHGHMANARHSTKNCPRGIVMYLGNNIVESDPKGIILAATFVPKIETDQAPAAKKTAVRVPASQYRVIIASSRSHWFQIASPQLLLIAAVDRMPSDAERVTAIGFVNNWLHIAPLFVALQRAMSCNMQVA